VARLAGESGDHRALVLTLAYTGIRWGEAVALRVRHVDEVRRRLLVTDNAVQLGVDPAVGDPKDDEPREVPVPKFLMTELKNQIRGLGADDLVFGNGADYLPRPKSNGGWFVGAAKRAKVQRITPHDLRHTAGNLAISAGANVLAVSRMLGHENPQVTLRYLRRPVRHRPRQSGRRIGHGPPKDCVQTGPKRVQQLGVVTG
jgi:integrase